MQCTDNQRNKGLKTVLDHGHLFNEDVYPKTYNQALYLMVNYKVPEDWKKKPYEKTSQQEGVAFVQQGAEKGDKNMTSCMLMPKYEG